MTTIEIDTEHGWGDVEMQVNEMETYQLLKIYDMFERNPTVFQLVAGEMMYRREHEVKLTHEGQAGEIEERLGR